MRSSCKERLLIEFRFLDKPRTVRELQDMIEAVTGTRPDRKTVADDMACIEAIYPPIVDTTSKEYTYHFSIEFLQEFFG